MLTLPATLTERYSIATLNLERKHKTETQQKLIPQQHHKKYLLFEVRKENAKTTQKNHSLRLTRWTVTAWARQ